MDAVRPLPCCVPSPPCGRLAASPRAPGRCGRPGSLSPLHPRLAAARGRAAAAMAAMAELGLTASPLLSPSSFQADSAIIFLSPCHPSRTPPSAMPRPVALVPPTAVAQAVGVRGQAASGLRGATCGHLRVCTNLLVLPHHSPAAAGPSPATTGRFPGVLCSSSRQGPRARIRQREGA